MSNELLAGLAAEEVKCPNEWCKRGIDFYPAHPPKTCDVCKGTGAVARFPTLRRKCRCRLDASFARLVRRSSIPCVYCKGAGWLPIERDVMETVLGIVVDGGMITRFCANLPGGWPFAKEPLEAALKALKATVERSAE